MDGWMDTWMDGCRDGCMHIESAKEDSWVGNRREVGVHARVLMKMVRQGSKGGRLVEFWDSRAKLGLGC